MAPPVVVAQLARFAPFGGELRGPTEPQPPRIRDILVAGIMTD
jgi:hypothetical protein